MISQPVSLSPLSVEDLVVQRQQQLLKRERLKLTSDQRRLFLSPAPGVNHNEYVIDAKDKKPTMCNGGSLHRSLSPTSVVEKKRTTLPAKSKRRTPDDMSDESQEPWSISDTGQGKYEGIEHKQEEEVDFSCLYPRDDRSCRVRFTPALSVYDHFEDDDSGLDHDDSLETIEEKTESPSTEADSRGLFLLRRARRCWYSADELKRIKEEPKSIVRMLKRLNFDTRHIDSSIYELRGLETYLSPNDGDNMQRKRRDACRAVLDEQSRQRKCMKKELDDDHLGVVSRSATECFRHLAFEIAKQDAKEAKEIYFPDVSMVCESLDESFGLMDIDDLDGRGSSGNNSTLRYWADSSWTKNLMEE